MYFSWQEQTGAPKVPQEAPPPKFPHPFGHLLDISFIHVRVFDVKKRVLETCCFFLELCVALSAFGDGFICNPSTPVQSKHTSQCLHFLLKQVP